MSGATKVKGLQIKSDEDFKKEEREAAEEGWSLAFYPWCLTLTESKQRAAANIE